MNKDNIKELVFMSWNAMSGAGISKLEPILDLALNDPAAYFCAMDLPGNPEDLKSREPLNLLFMGVACGLAYCSVSEDEGMMNAMRVASEIAKRVMQDRTSSDEAEDPSLH